MAGQRTDKNLVTSLQHPKVEAPWSPKNIRTSGKYKGGRVLFIDSDIVPGAFYNECAWITPFMAEQSSDSDKNTASHKHDADEVVCFFGTNPKDLHDLDGELEFWVGGEKHILTKSVMVYVPAGVEHGPLIFRKVNRPIFHFTCTPEAKYYYQDKKNPPGKKSK